jgi:hypothetical protein
MGRNSADATNACLIRAARAALADLLAVVLLLRREALVLLLAAEGLVLFLGVVAVEPSGCVVPAEVCPVTGETAIKIAKAPASTRIAARVEFGEFTTLMFSL